MAAGPAHAQGITHLDHDRPRQERVKCVVVGDSAVGKTRLICARARNAKFTLKELCLTHIPTVFAIDQYHQHQEVLENSWEIVDDVSVTLRLWDTFGTHDKDRKFAFGRSDVIALCFSICSPQSLRNVVDKWWPEIRHFCKTTPIVLIGCRNDMRHLWKDPAYIKLIPDERKRVKESDIILPERGRAVAAQIGAVAYYETSVFSGFGVRSVFTNAIRAALLHRRQTRFWASHLKSVRGAEWQSPYLIPPPPTPEHHSSSSTFAEDLSSLASPDAPFPDVEFICLDGTVRAHAILLAAASLDLHRILSTDGSTAEDGHACFTKITATTTERNSRLHLLTLRTEFLTRTLLQLVHFLYTGILDMAADTVQPLQRLSENLGVKFLTKIIASRLSGDGDDAQSEEGNLAISKQFLSERNRRLAVLAQDSHTPYSDVSFQAADGVLVPSFRGLVTKRSSFMSAMFCGSFEEQAKPVIQIPDIDPAILRYCLFFLYMDQCPKTNDVVEAVEILAVADRFCLPRLMDLVQDYIVAKFLTLSTEDVDQSRSECIISMRALELLEIAEAFNAGYLYSWCCNFITTHYVFISRLYMPQLRALTPLHQAMLSKQRWPPVWYVNEYDLYEQSLERRRHEMLQMLRKRRSRFALVLHPGGGRDDCVGEGMVVRNPPVPIGLRRSRSSNAPVSRAAQRWRLLLCSR
ncbi:Rho-related BTB domain-containing protein 2 [Hypsibius exemplaris]|uniref:Rho-related BTB domain-containing protein 2 n=1 Tax=Hypsibius exemplaris TaxID=2072580 RepID=A0A1W0W8P9_HYPEX|nr:Rho-related BTB domain-containing protein 2 [Hypsibius exemplaris]